MVQKVKSVLNNPLYQVAFILFLFEAVFTSRRCYPFDTYCVLTWCIDIFKNGISQAYHISNPVFNYPPLICYPLFLFSKFAGTVLNIETYFHFFKTFALLFDFIGALLVVQLAGNNNRKILLFLLLVANPAFIYNSYCWGQYDSVFATLVFISFVFILKERLLWGLLFFLLAINFKAQAIIFIPPLILFGLYKFWGKVSFMQMLKVCGLIALVETVIFLPFIIAGEFGTALNMIFRSVDFYPQVCMGAFNFWFLTLGQNCFELSDKETFIGVSYKHWGLLMFCATSFLTLLPLFAAWLAKAFFKKSIQLPDSSLYACFALIPLVFFYFNTQMHERYLHPAFIFVAMFAFYNRNYFVFVLLSIAYFFALEGFTGFFDFPNKRILFFNRFFIASLYTVVIVLMFYYLYKPFVAQLKKSSVV